MEWQAKLIASWGSNVDGKIPITNTKGELSAPLVKRLAATGVRVNVTAVFTLDQVEAITDSLSLATPAVISVFAGRIADTGVDPLPIMRELLTIMK